MVAQRIVWWSNARAGLAVQIANISNQSAVLDPYHLAISYCLVPIREGGTHPMCVPSYTPRTDGRMDMDRQLLRSNSRFRAIERAIYHKKYKGSFFLNSVYSYLSWLRIHH